MVFSELNPITFVRRQTKDNQVWGNCNIVSGQCDREAFGITQSQKTVRTKDRSEKIAKEARKAREVAKGSVKGERKMKKRKICY